ncbi:phenylacetate-CoA oxygenase subunit PaaJ [Fictibacillus macauensis ZFHKF-1]|uniref:Phenylacetate-CoA oxygenase subunit PaaJ n=1 Tax=Fictibacillus macauensis ZFHKF-1 TaxID=1196324 RepID=I8AJ56_9BACL|nr:1,2-phenylacetyl-CoA epoxidase subunit PaaD [Fictibacillus macauensis]EIT85822.1 phenylacetate-CoA oxygenase subunit PaaJ [Fictibacillus macauensis ZFHKF-1]
MNSVNKQQRITEALATVKDPEIASVSIVDLGMIGDVHDENGVVTIHVLPTFTGCPALPIIKRDIVNAVSKLTDVNAVQVEFVYSPAWTTDRITEAGKAGLKEFGIAPPPAQHVLGEPWEIDCPYCNSSYVTMENIFGPTACRSILYCRSCKNPFEAMKPVADLDEIIR